MPFQGMFKMAKQPPGYNASGDCIIEAKGTPGFEHIQFFSARMNNGIGARAICQQLNCQGDDRLCENPTSP